MWSNHQCPALKQYKQEKILFGCGHSFHHKCFPCSQGICYVYKEKLLDAMKFLLETASEAIFNPESSKSKV